MSVLRRHLLATTLLVAATPMTAVYAQDAANPAGTLGAASTAPAQNPTDPEAQADAAESVADQGGEIVVTGSRIRRPDLESASPIAVVDSQQIQSQGIVNTQDLLQKLPQVGIPGLSRTNSNFLTSGNGVATIDLRNLGDSRTLVLVNGRRFVPGVAGTSIVDVNNIPADFVDRIEVVTGGASAIYGSDAIAGVVNYVLKTDMQGIVGRAQYGLTSRGDSQNYTASLTGGTKFGADDRGSIIANVTYSKDLGLLSRKRAISAEDCSAAGCGPQSYSSYPAQGRFEFQNSNNENGVASNEGGYASNLFTFNPDNSVVTGFPTGYGFNRNSVRRISTPIERYLAAGSAQYRFSDAATAFVEATYAKTKSSSQIEALALDSQTDVGVGYGIDNPFIPLSIRQQIAARNSDAIASNDVTSIDFRRRQNEVFSRSNRNDRDTMRFAGGLRGDLGSKWQYETSVVYGQLKDRTSSQDIDITRYANALDATTDAQGNIICRDATARAAGCVPINLFGYNTATPEASAYVRAAVPRAVAIKNTQFVASGSVSGSLFALPYGDVQVALGAEYRREKSAENWDELTNAGQNSGNQTPDTVGKFNVKELFGEIDVPLLKDISFVNSLSIQGAARYSDYSTIGRVFSWNAGGEYSPVRGLRFRGNYAVANRAPNIGELFSSASETFPTVQDPCDGVTATSTGTYDVACRAIPGVASAISRNGTFEYTLADIQSINGFNGGNRNLQEEKGKTLTFGAVFAPDQVRGLSLTVDYFDIKLTNAIDIIPRATSIQQCLLTNLPQFCNNVIRNTGTGFIRTVNAQNVNIADTKTRGIDVNLRYGRALGLVADDRFDVNVLYTHTLRYQTQSDPSAPVYSGVGNIEFGSVFRDKVNATATYGAGPFSVNWTATYLSPMVDTVRDEFAESSEGLDPEIIAHNEIKSRIYHDVQFRARVGDTREMELFVGVNNLFDRKPPKLEDTVFYGSITGTTTAADIYDPIGRRFYAGAQVRF
ncbi:TonB-dependent receptor [Microvirga sp. SRT01]|uniref:TonB-dependent receptor n=1 Tax=Sphingomonas longa TaxID=2778730 RepID=A0ABS2D6Q2_9SPHN|nr:MULTISPECIES: TonB-dependent receptor [Alphaproteobacteria]MBM6576608.1 TonB-dependent receptor [Sphingomonas sp. BT552]MBR7709654.1 TonB-dependent receptor [Microvirga sp. SRT01]